VGLTNARRLNRDERTTGWVAASETFLAGVWSDTSLRWLARRTPVARIGPSMRLYYIPPDSALDRLTRDRATRDRATRDRATRDRATPILTR
jgi:hypothetical protein